MKIIVHKLVSAKKPKTIEQKKADFRRLIARTRQSKKAASSKPTLRIVGGDGDQIRGQEKVTGEQPSPAVKVTYRPISGRVKCCTIAIVTESDIAKVSELINSNTSIIRVELIAPLQLRREVRYTVLSLLVNLPSTTKYQIGARSHNQLLELWLEQDVSTAVAEQQAFMEGATEIAALTTPDAADAVAARMHTRCKAIGGYCPSAAKIAKNIRKISGHQSPSDRITIPRVADDVLVSEGSTVVVENGLVVPHVIHYAGAWYLYDGKKRCRYDDRAFEDRIKLFVAMKYPAIYSSRFIVDLLELLRARTNIVQSNDCDSYYLDDDGIWNEARVICVANGVLDIGPVLDGTGDVVLLAPSPRYFAPCILPVVFDATAKAPKFQTYLSEVLPKTDEGDNRRRIVQEIFGYCLAGRWLRLEKLFILLGGGSNGKSILVIILRALLGDGNVSGLTLDQFHKQFLVGGLVGKLANIGADMGVIDNADESILKLIASFDAMLIDIKHKSPITVRVFAKLLFLTNSLPRFRDSSNGTIRRLVLIPFLEQFDEDRKDVDLHTALLTELPGILNWALRGLKRLAREKKFIDCSVCQLQLDRFKITNDSVQGFVDDCCVLEQNEQIPTNVVYSYYQKWCADNGCKAVRQSEMVQRLKPLGVEEYRPRVPGDDKRPRHLHGISLRELELMS